MAEKGLGPELPPPPEMKRTVEFYPTQLIAVPILILISALGLAKVFDSQMETRDASAQSVSLSVRYPSKVRDLVEEPMEITVKNGKPTPIAKMEVRISKAYFDHFQEADFNPQPTEIEGGFMVFEFDDVAPGEDRSVEIAFHSDQMGSVSGSVKTEIDGREGPVVAMETFAFP